MAPRENLSSMPAFTQDDEEAEISRLTEYEIQVLMNDLLGGSSSQQDHPGYYDERTGTYTDPIVAYENQNMKILLAKMRLLLKRIPDPHDKILLLDAQRKCPHEFTNEKLTLFLRKDKYHVQLAVNRIIEYWKERHALFMGDEYCFKDITTTNSGAMSCDPTGNHEALKQGYLTIPFATTGGTRDTDSDSSSCDDHKQEEKASCTDTMGEIYTNSVMTDDMGRPVIILNSGRHTRNVKYTLQQMQRACWYIFEQYMKLDLTTQYNGSISKNGIVMIVNPGDDCLTNFDRKLERYLFAVLEEKVMPIELKVVHLAKDDVAFHSVIKPVIFQFLSKRQRLRYRIHKSNNQEQKFISLERYGIPRSLIPEDIRGGNLKFDYEDWLMKQCKAEKEEEEQEVLQLMGEQQKPGSALEPVPKEHLRCERELRNKLVSLKLQ